jgi:hypothetical protein
MIEPLVAATLGPAGAVAVLLLVLIGIYRLSVSYVFPIAKEYVLNQQENLKYIMTEHSKDREVFKDTITILVQRQTKLEEDVNDIKTDIKIIKERM